MKIISPIINKQNMLARQYKTDIVRHGFENSAGLLGSILAEYPALDYADELLEKLQEIQRSYHAWACGSDENPTKHKDSAGEDAFECWDICQKAQALLDKIKKGENDANS